jgi:hypothetical protein
MVAKPGLLRGIKTLNVFENREKRRIFSPEKERERERK